MFMLFAMDWLTLFDKSLLKSFDNIVSILFMVTASQDQIVFRYQKTLWYSFAYCCIGTRSLWWSEIFGVAISIPYWNVEFDESDVLSVADAIRNRNISQGEITKCFEDEISQLLGIEYVFLVTSGSMALVLSLLACGIGKDD